MFSYRDSCEGDVHVDVAFTDSTVDLQELRPGLATELPRVEEACGVRFARLHQVHGADVVPVDQPGPPPLDDVPTGDALVTATRGVGLMIRVADCVPVLLADPGAGVIGAVHAGRQGVALDVVGHAVDRMRDAGATSIVGWIGPHVCGGCYEVPDALRTEVAALVPSTWAQTTWGTPSLDLGAGVRSQLVAAGVRVTDVGRCTREDAGLHSYRRDGAEAGRFAGLVWMS
ncbi:polyphenol oxidase family protein [Nocardioides sp. LS1]|uniref:polyphenol oxidase family protein n=1 Tax=Nocardioides sp. LS1 TaxID=1027620 RepID=UPI000F616FE2|nr:polyphenol oxidase family protein [Nocardioides sp. LS1]GCD91694.1 laccase domain protein [Nocardioides sp. LS1]